MLLSLKGPTTDPLKSLPYILRSSHREGLIDGPLLKHSPTFIAATKAGLKRSPPLVFD